MRLLRVRTPLGLFSSIWAVAAALHYLESKPFAGLPIYPFVILLLLYPEWLWAIATFAVHVGFVAKDHAEVDAFFKAAVDAGGKSKEAPQARPEYYPGYYATWVLDPDGHDIEVVHKS